MLFKHKHLILEFWALLFSIRFLYISPGFSLVLLQPLFSGTSTVGLVSGWALQTQVSWFLVPSKRWELAESSAQPCKRLLHVGARFECHTKSSTYVPGSKVAIYGMVISPWIGNPYNGYIKPLLLSLNFRPPSYGKNGSFRPQHISLYHFESRLSMRNHGIFLTLWSLRIAT